MKKTGNYEKIILSALFLAIGMVLPLITGQIKEIGDSLLPMHFPVILCGIICGAKYGFTVGLILPFFRSFIFGMPPFFPNAVWMSAELAAYGFVVGLLYNHFFKKQLWWLYASMIISMISGRVVWGITKLLLYGLEGKVFSFQMFISGALLDAWAGIILQLVLIPFIVSAFKRKG